MDKDFNPYDTVLDESMWMIMTDLNIRSIPNFPEAFEAYITLEVFEDRVFGNSLRFLHDYSDVKEKYRRKQIILNDAYILPSEKSMINAASYYKPDVINVTPDPNSSDVYKAFYRSVKDTFYTYDPANYQAAEGKFIVLYNSDDTSEFQFKDIVYYMECD